jgi:hypothetical protein
VGGISRHAGGGMVMTGWGIGDADLSRASKENFPRNNKLKF